MSDRIKLKTPNGKTEIEVFASEKKRFTDHGYTEVGEKPAKKSSVKTNEEEKHGDIQG